METMKSLFNKVKPDAQTEDRAVSELITDQRKRESVNVWRRGWCISEATIVVDDGCSPEALLKMADAIYDYVYGHEPEGEK